MWFSKNKKPGRLVAYFDVIDWDGEFRKCKGEYSLGLSCWIIETYLSKLPTKDDGTFDSDFKAFRPKKWAYSNPVETKLLLKEYIARNSEVGTIETFEENNTKYTEVFPEMIEHKGK